MTSSKPSISSGEPPRTRIAIFRWWEGLSGPARSLITFVGGGLILIPLAGALFSLLVDSVRDKPEGVAVVTTWPRGSGCDITDVGAVSGAAAPAAGTTQLDSRLFDDPGYGAWSKGTLTMTMTATGDRAVVVRDVSARIEPTDDAPGWVFDHSGQCGDIDQRVLSLDLDDRRLSTNPTGEDDSGQPAAISFTVEPDDPVEIVVSPIACAGSYDFWIRVESVPAGATEVTTREVGPFRVYGGPHILADSDIEWFGPEPFRMADPRCSSE